MGSAAGGCACTLFVFLIAAILDASRNGGYDSGDSGEQEHSTMEKAARGLAALRNLKMMPVMSGVVFCNLL